MLKGEIMLDFFRWCCDWTNKWEFVTFCQGAGKTPDTALPCHTLVQLPDKRKSLRSYTASAKPDFTAERSAQSCSASSSGHQQPVATGYTAGCCAAQRRTLSLIMFHVISGHEYLTTDTHTEPLALTPAQHWTLTLRCVTYLCVLHRISKCFCFSLWCLKAKFQKQSLQQNPQLMWQEWKIEDLSSSLLQDDDFNNDL